jgi:hypothetical protein
MASSSSRSDVRGPARVGRHPAPDGQPSRERDGAKLVQAGSQQGQPREEVRPAWNGNVAGDEAAPLEVQVWLAEADEPIRHHPVQVHGDEGEDVEPAAQPGTVALEPEVGLVDPIAAWPMFTASMSGAMDSR